MDSNQSGAVGGIILGVFQGSLTHLGASRRLRGQRYIKARPILGHILTFFDPPCQPGQIFWSKIACTGVSHIVLHVLCSTRTSGGHLRPSEVTFRAILSVSGDLFYKAKTHFSQKGPFPSTDLAENQCVDSQTPPGPKSKCWQMSNSWPQKIVQARGVRHFSTFNCFLYRQNQQRSFGLVLSVLDSSGQEC